jgi:hypothetical protein
MVKKSKIYSLQVDLDNDERILLFPRNDARGKVSKHHEETTKIHGPVVTTEFGTSEFSFSGC